MTNGDGTDTSDPVQASDTDAPVERRGERAGRDVAGHEEAGRTAMGSPADPFATLGNETRIRIVDALYEHTGASVLRDGVAYSALRSHAGVADKGNFNYHLDVLRDRFVEKADGEYRLTFAGFEVAKALRAGAWADHEPRGPVEVEAASPLLDGEPLYASYDGSLVDVHPEEGEPVFRIAVRPSGASRRDLDELVDLLAALLVEGVAKTQQGICPYCHAPPDRTVLDGAAAAAGNGTGDATADGAAGDGRWRYRFAATCPECGPLFEVPVGAAVVRHPAVVGFYWDHGVDVRIGRPWNLELFGDGAVQPVNRGTDGESLRLTVERGGEVLALTLDGRGRVVETVRR